MAHNPKIVGVWYMGYYNAHLGGRSVPKSEEPNIKTNLASLWFKVEGFGV